MSELEPYFRCEYCKDDFPLSEHGCGYDLDTGNPICIHCQAECEAEGQIPISSN